MHNKKLTNELYLVSFFLIIITIFTSVAFGFFSFSLKQRDISLLALISGGLFLFLLIISTTHKKLFFLILPLMIIGFPTIINRFMPSIVYGNELNGSIITFPLISFFDVFMSVNLLVVLYKKSFRINFSKINSKLTLVVLFIILTSFIVNLFYSSTKNEFLITFSFLFHGRYILWFLALFSLTDVHKYSKYILYGLIFSVSFLFLESVIYTKISHLDRLTSGSLQLNTFGNIIAAITVFFIFNLRKYNQSLLIKILMIFSIIVGFIIILGTQNRSSLLSASLGAIILFLLLRFKLKSFLLPSIIITVCLYFTPFKTISSILPERYDVVNKYKSFSYDFKNGFNIDLSEETSSMHSRFKLWNTSVKMIKASPFFGIGGGRFNFYKKDYGFAYRAIIDPHNSAFSMLVFYGLPAIFIFYFIYLYPFYLHKKIPKENRNNLTSLFVVNFIMLFTDLSNSSFEKPGIYAFLVFNTLYLLYTYNRHKEVSSNLPTQVQ